MFGYIWHTIFFDPVYNTLVFFIDAVPHGDVGLAIILTVVLVKIVILPVSLKAARAQLVMRELEPKLTELKEKYKDKREELARKTMELYRNAGVNPLLSILLLFIQIPIVIALYLAVYRGGGVPLPDINTALLYAFIPTPETATMLFWGTIDMAGKSIPLALLVGITQFFYGRLSIPKHPPRKEGAEPNFKEDLSRSMSMQMRYVMPVIIASVAYTSAAIALYFLVSNIMAIIQEYVMLHKGLKTKINHA